MVAAQVVLGAIVAIVITILVESLRKPRVSIRILPPADTTYTNKLATNARFLSVGVVNNALPTWARWMSRNAATQAHGEITFYHLDGQNFFGRSMPARWTGSPDPVSNQTLIGVGNRIIALQDAFRFSVGTRVDIPPGEAELIKIAGKFDNDSECFGWSNESYFSDPLWRNPNWELPSDRYLVKVVVTTSGEKATEVFRMINNVARTDFRLEPKMPDDEVSDWRAGRREGES